MTNSWSASPSPTLSASGLPGTEERSTINLRLLAGVALLGLGTGLFGLAIFHAFAHGSCSSTGYSRNYGPIQRCAGGTGWWMLMLLGGLVVAGIGFALAGSASAFGPPLLFMAIGVASLGLAFTTGKDVHLLVNGSSGSGKVFVAIFGGCFMLGGLVWGWFAASGVAGEYDARSWGVALVGLVAGVGVAFAIAAGVSSAIGPQKVPASNNFVTVSGGSGGTITIDRATSAAQAAASAAAARRTAAAIAQANRAARQATSQAGVAEKLAACVGSAGTDVAKITACQAKYKP